MQKDKSILADRKIEVIGKDVPEDVRSAVADLCVEIKDLKEFKKNAKKIRDMLERKFDKGWNVIVGESFSGNCTIAEGHYLEICIGDVFILVFKSSGTITNKDAK